MKDLNPLDFVYQKTATSIILLWNTYEISRQIVDSGRRFNGNVKFVSPEIIDVKEQITEAADVFSLGLLIYSLFTNKYAIYHTKARSITVDFAGVPEGA